MKVAILSESEADEAAIRILVEGLLGRKTEPTDLPFIRSRGFDAVLRILPVAMRHLHYQTDADALVVVCDSDRTAVHDMSHGDPNGAEGRCRLCQMKAIAAQVRAEAGNRAAYGSLKVALGLAVPQIEAWYLVGRDPHVSEASWINGLKSKRPPYAPENLKRQVYGTDRPSLRLETEQARQQAKRIVFEGHLPVLEQLFPGGFGPLAEAARTWSTGSQSPRASS
jgi:hypothetical protein